MTLMRIVEHEGGAVLGSKLLCDAGSTCAPDCRVRVDLKEGEAVPEGWSGRQDPWGRVSQFTGDVLVLHLCPECLDAPRPLGTVG